MYKVAIVLATSLVLNSLYAQESEFDTPVLTSKDSIVQSSWMFGLGWNFVNDSGTRFNKPFKVKNHINAVAFPSRMSLGRYFRSGIGLEGIATYNRYKQGNIIDGLVNPEDKDYFGFDIRMSYDLNKLVGQTDFFDPYLGIGAGYSYANDLGRGTYNAVVGFRTWFNDRWALDFNSSGKWSFGNEASNHVQHGLGVIYQFSMEKTLSKRGAEKLVMIRQIEAEQQRINDSIAQAKEAEEKALLLAQQLDRERALAEAKAREEAEQKRREDLLNRMRELGQVYFDFDSSYLSAPSKASLDTLAMLMNENQDISIEVSAHADSRGPDRYNIWLSERRANRVVDYLAKKDVDTSRMKARGYGEQRLTNHCKNNVRCTSKEHRANRRSELEVLASQ